MNKEELYNIKDGDTGQQMAEGLKKNFEGIIDSIPDTSGFATKQELTDAVGNIETILDNIIGG